MNPRIFVRLSFSMMSIFAISLHASAHASTVAPTSDDIVRDSHGRVDYMVELYPEIPSAYVKKLLHTGRFPAYHKPQVVNAVEDIERNHGITAHSVTSWTVPSFTAFLTEEQAHRMRQDPRVASMGPNRWGKFSIAQVSDSGAVWSDSVGTEVKSWGKMAVNASSTSSNGSAIVYVLDAGVGQHQDLYNVVKWVNALTPSHSCVQSPTGLGVLCANTGDLSWVVGCYTHATAVAGVIGARADGFGTQGINPGVSIVSVAASTEPPSGNCLPTSLNADVAAAGLDWIASDIAARHTQKPSVVNMSFNVDMTNLQSHMKALASSTPGAVVVQAAGNFNDRACAYAYDPLATVDSTGTRIFGSSDPANPSDGIVVIGAINNHGQAVVPLTTLVGIPTGFWKQAAPFGYEAGSDWGSCVDVWAPGDGIYTLVANPSTADDQLGGTAYTTYGMSSGTSMAAPHVAGLASVLIEQQSFSTPREVEAAIRGHSYALGSADKANIAIKMPSLNPLPAGTASKPYGELYLKVHPSTSSSFESINGYEVCFACNFTGDQPGGFVNVGTTMGIKFAASGISTTACTVTRTSGSTTINLISNGSSFPDPKSWILKYWNSGSGATSSTWAVGTNCFPSGWNLTSKGASIKATPNPVTIPGGQSSAPFTLSWNFTGYASQVYVYGQQNGGSNPNQTLCLGSTSTSPGSAPEGVSSKEIATFWMSTAACTADGTPIQPPGSYLDTIKLTTTN